VSPGGIIPALEQRERAQTRREEVAHTEFERLESGAVFNPATPVLRYGIPEEADRQLRPSY
jgi:hypothetical protein